MFDGDGRCLMVGVKLRRPGLDGVYVGLMSS